MNAPTIHQRISKGYATPCDPQSGLSPVSPWTASVLKAVRRASLAAAFVLAPAITLGLYAPAAHGQASNTTDAVGKITDSTGATIPGATVHIINNATGTERTTTTSDSGDFSVPNLLPSNYTVRVEKAGFKTSQITSLDVEIGKTANVALVLSVGGTNEVVEVTALPPQLQTAEATVGQVIDQKQINDLPLNGRNVLQLATLAPGVSPAETGQTGSPGRFGTRSLFITVDGGRGSSTNYVLDGTYVRSIRFNNLSLQPNVDTLQEFNLLRNSFGTEYGQGIAVVSMVTKSGSNQVHGTAYDFARNSVFDARNYFSTVSSFPTKPSFSRQQFGGTLGGPIKKDKLFIFGGYEGLRTNRATPVFGSYPTQALLTTLQPGVTALSRLAQVENPTFPVPQTAGGANTLVGGNNFAAVPIMTDNYDEYTIRADQTLSQRHTIFERYIDFNSLQFLPSVQGGINNKLIGRNGVFGDTFLLSPNVVNEFRVGYNEYYNFELGVGLNPGTNYAAQEGLQNVTGLTDPTEYGRANVTITGYTNIFDNVTNQGGDENIISIGDSVSVVHGKNTYKFGFQGQNRRVILIADNNDTGAFTFSACSATACDAANKINPVTGTYWTALANYQRGYCTSSCNGNFGTTRGHYRDNTYGAFISDVWQAGHGVTINAGLRWEYNAPFVEQNGLEGTLNPALGQIEYSKIPTVLPPAFVNAGAIDTTSTYPPGIIAPNKKGFGPRLGIAYEAAPGTVFRAGGGIYFDNINTNELQFTRYAAPLYYQQSLTNVFVQNLFPNPTNIQPTAQGLPAPFSVLPGNRTPYTIEYNASVQQDMGHGLIMELAYTASATHKLWKRFDQNEDLLVPGYIAPGVSNRVNVGVRPYPIFQHGILTSSTEASGSFQGGSVKVEKRNKNGLYFLGSYQWSKNIDNGSGEVEANDTAYSTDFAFDRSLSRYDVRNRSAISGGYELPFGKGHDLLQKGIGNALAGGWSLQTAIQIRGGYPFSPSRSGATFGTYVPGRVNLAPGRTIQSAKLAKRFPGAWFDPTAFVNPGPTVQGNVTRNVLIGPGTRQVDLSAIKNFHLVERVSAQFRAEAYNIINTGIFSAPAANISTTGTVGQISSTAGDNRSIQLAFKVLF